jgi:hypothetical protein
VNNIPSFEERHRQLSEAKNRIAEEEALIREEAHRELARIIAEINSLEEQKEQLEALLGIEDAAIRAEHGKIRDVCFSVLSRNTGGMTSGQIREIIEQENPGLRVSSVTGTLSRQMMQGKLRRDDAGRYYLA